MPRIPMKNGDEYDILSRKSRKVRCLPWIRRNSSRVKRAYRRRERMLAARDLLKRVFEERVAL